MPLPNRHQGRPDTRVIPTDWERTHAPVATKTMTAMIRIWPPVSGPAFVPGEGYTDPGTTGTADYDGPARIQSLDANAARRITGDEDQATAGYLVAIDIDATTIRENSTIEVVTSNDPWLTPDRRLIVRGMDLGSFRFERDLYAVDLISRPQEA